LARGFPVAQHLLHGIGGAEAVGRQLDVLGVDRLDQKGVTTITSSVSPFLNAVERNSEPSIGRSPAPGSLVIVFCAELLSRPAIMKLWPEPSSTVVSARRTFSPGIE
jgi:hypothetical protein